MQRVLRAKITKEVEKMIIRKLRPGENGLTRQLWEEVFTEDTKEFLDYYYSQKTTDNEIYVIERDGQIRSMLHLNPYLLKVGEKEEGSRYIVAVATDPLCRSQGYMKELLQKAVRDMYVQKIPFAYLMPAAEAIYYPHNFRYIYAAEQWKAEAVQGEKLTLESLLQHESGAKVTLRKAQEADCRRIAQFAEEILEHTYRVYARRDWLYYENLLLEQACQKGGILLAESEGEIRGVLLFDEEQGFAVREPLVAPGYERIFEEGGLLLKKEEKKPIIMGRIIHVETLLSCMRCTEKTEFEFVLADPVIRENNKHFIIRGNEEHIVVRTRPLIKGKYEKVQMISIDALTTLLFGYKPLEKIEEEEKEQFSDDFKEAVVKLIPLGPVFLNEIV